MHATPARQCAHGIEIGAGTSVTQSAATLGRLPLAGFQHFKAAARSLQTSRMSHPASRANRARSAGVPAVQAPPMLRSSEKIVP